MIAFLLGYEFAQTGEQKRLIYWSACALCSVVLGIFGRAIIEFGIAVIYPRYDPERHFVLG